MLRIKGDVVAKARLRLAIGVTVRVHEISPRAFLANVYHHGFLEFGAGKRNEEDALFIGNVVSPVDFSGRDMSDLTGIH